MGYGPVAEITNVARETPQPVITAHFQSFRALRHFRALGKSREELEPAPHEPVAEVVDVARDAPPAGDQQPPPARRLEALQAPH